MAALEALEERAAIIAEGCGVDPAQAHQEARWRAERERTWRAFLRILQAPATPQLTKDRYGAVFGVRRDRQVLAD